MAITVRENKPFDEIADDMDFPSILYIFDLFFQIPSTDTNHYLPSNCKHNEH